MKKIAVLTLSAFLTLSLIGCSAPADQANLPIESEEVELLGFVDFLESEYQYTQGIMGKTSHLAPWVEKNSEIILKYNQEKYIYIEIFINDLSEFQDGNPTLTTSLNDKIIDQSTIEDQGMFTIKIELTPETIPTETTSTVKLEFDQTMTQNGEVTEMAFKLRKVGFQN